MAFDPFAAPDTSSVMQRVATVRKQEQKKRELAYDTDALDKLVADSMKQLVGPDVKVRTQKHPSRTAAVRAAIPSDSPFAGMGADLTNTYRQMLTDPQYKGVGPNEILQNAFYSELARPGESGRSRLEEGYLHKREADVSPFDIVGLGAPAGDVAEPPGYQNWLKDVQAQETAELEKEAPFDLSTLALSGLAGGATGFAAGGPAGAVTGALLGLGSELFAQPASKQLRSSEWYRANMASGDLSDVGQALIADLGLYALGGIGTGKLLKTAPGIEKAAYEGVFGKSAMPETQDMLAEFQRRESGILRKEFKQLTDNAVQDLESGKYPPYSAQNLLRTATTQDVREKVTESLVAKAGQNKAEIFDAIQFNRVKDPLTPEMKTLKDIAAVDQAQNLPAVIYPFENELTTTVDVALGKSVKRISPRSMFQNLDDQHAGYAIGLVEQQGMALEQASMEAYGAMKAAKLVTRRNKMFERLAQPEALRTPPKPKVGVSEAEVARRKMKASSYKYLKNLGYTTDEMKAIIASKEVETVDSTISHLQSKPVAKEIAKQKTAQTKVAKKIVKAKTASKAKKVTKANVEEATVTTKSAENFLKKLSKGKATKKEKSAYVKKLATDPDFYDAEVTRVTRAPQAEQDAFDKASQAMAQLADKVDSPFFDKNLAKLLGVPVAIMALPMSLVLGGANDAEASVLSTAGTSVARALSSVTKSSAAAKAGEKVSGMLSELADAKLVGLPLAEGKKTIDNFVEPLLTRKMTEKRFGSVIKTVRRRESLPFGAEKFLSPHGAGTLAYKMPPTVDIASLRHAWGWNVKNSMQAVKNIMDAVPGFDKNSWKSISAEMAEVSDEFSDTVVAFSSVEGEIKTINNQLKKLKSIKVKGDEAERTAYAVDELENKLAILTNAHKKMAPQVEKFEGAWTAKVRELAEKHPSTRISLAAEDTENFEYYPWLKDMMSDEEVVATNYVKNMMIQYRDRSVEAGLDVLKNRPFMHHAWHPGWKNSNAVNELEAIYPGLSKSVPYTSFHRRSKFSKQMVPDVFYNMNYYLPDAESRIGWKKFWTEWQPHRQSEYVRTSPLLENFWQQIEQASAGQQLTSMHKWANRYSSFEVLRLIGFAPSTAFKHLFKVTGTWATLGAGEAMKHVPDVTKTYIRSALNNEGFQSTLKKLGFENTRVRQSMTERYTKSLAEQHFMMNTLGQLEYNKGLDPTIWGKFDATMQKANEKGAVLIQAIESWDRIHSVLAASEMAAKRGLTAKDALYSVYNTVLTNNFLGGPLNPSWARNPTTRALMLFQVTPFKIWERRLVRASQAFEDVKLAGRVVKRQDVSKTLAELRDLGSFVTKGESQFKQNMIADALYRTKDPLGVSVTKQFMQEALLTGLIIGGGYKMGVDLTAHTLHVPFMKVGRDEPTLTISPLPSAAIKFGRGEIEPGVNPMWGHTANFLQDWFGKGGPVPSTIQKGMRISKGDIPERYREGPLKPWAQYLFVVPTKGKGGH